MAKLPRFRKVRMFVVSLALLLTVLGAVALGVHQSAPVHAQSYNAQQVGIYCDPTYRYPVDWIELYGTNQYGNHVSYQGRPSDAGSSWVVWNWWWQGSITVVWHQPNKGWFYNSETVPWWGQGLVTIAACH